MGLTMQERHALVRELSTRFQRSSKKQRSAILTNFVQLTGYTRCYAAFILRTCGKKYVRMLNGKRIVFIPGHARARGLKRQRKGRYRSKAFLGALRKLWALSDGLCGKRLVVFVREIVPLLESQKRLYISDPLVREQILTASAATIDRVLAATKRQTQFRSRSRTRPGALLKHHIAVRTFADWSDARPGFCEADLVAHDGGSAYGDFVQTLTMVDIVTCWSEAEPAKNKAQKHVFAALEEARVRFPFALLGLDCDNGSEFINAQLQAYCEDHQVTFTRSRAYHKNDNCYVEQKNNSIVRRAVGYYRYDTPKELELLTRLYRLLGLYTNFFLPVMKLKEKLRHGSKLTRRYDAPQTPYRRVLEHPEISQEVKTGLRSRYESLNLIEIRGKLSSLQQELFRLAIKAGPPPQAPPYVRIPRPDHPWSKGRPLARKKPLEQKDTHAPKPEQAPS